MDSYNNISYLFIPFRYERQSQFSTLIQALNRHDGWEIIHDDIKYMLKYVADKIDSRNPDACQCFHFALKEESREALDLPGVEEWCCFDQGYQDSREHFRFHLQSVQLYCFSTTVCVMALRLHFERSDPRWIAAAQYYLKKASRQAIYREAHPGRPPFRTLELAEKLAAGLDCSIPFQFFFYANPTTERANFLTYLEVEEKEDYRQDLFYLRRCYGDGYLYQENPEEDRREIYSSTRDTIWGVSPEAAVCLSRPGLGRAHFLRGTFSRNFNAQYLFMYVLLLHQKYVLYMFLTLIGVGAHNDLEVLEDYRHQLYEFETNFVFSCVTEVPQYQTLYEKLTEAFALQKLYDDVREPIVSLSEVRQHTAEAKQKNRDKRTNSALFMLSLLSLFSALVDSFDFAQEYISPIGGTLLVNGVQAFCFVVIFALLGYVIYNLYRSRND